jgi:hypothetical protein
MMPISFADYPYPNQVLVLVSGETSMQEMMNVIIATRSGEQRTSAFLFDVSAAKVDLSGDQVRQLAAFTAEEARKSPMGPVAFISTDPATFGLSRMYQAYSASEGRKNVGVFRTLADAQAWLARV